MVQSTRDQRADILRVLAVFGVFVVNGMGYSFAPEHVVPMGMPHPGDSSASVVLYALLFFFFQGKAWPLLCFLFGYSLQSIAKQSMKNQLPVTSALRRRYGKLLILGVLHGVFVYFGDVLTIYAICGWIATRWATSQGQKRIKISGLLRIWKKWAVATIITQFLVILLVFLASLQETPASETKRLFAEFSLWRDFFQLNIEYYGYIVLASTSFMLPVYIWLTISGMLAYRLRLLSKRAFAVKFWSHAPGLVQTFLSTCLTLSIAIFATRLQVVASDVNLVGSFVLLSIPVGIWWLFCCLAWYMRESSSVVSPLLAQFAIAAKYSLTMYLGLSIFLVICVNPVFGGWLTDIFKHTIAAFISLLCLWLGALKLAVWAHQRGWRDPLSIWLGKSHAAAGHGKNLL